ncbi:MAG TPA: exonuclease domain-containing protein [Acidimicrobiales bacterium]|nr:exonuclease domain-containing protein [Acidimicrobiales bacterium]
MPEAKHLLWFDLETTGTDEAEDKILEVGSILTGVDPPFETLSEFSGVVHYPATVAHLMNDFVLEMHTGNGLLEAVERSPLSLVEVEAMLIESVLVPNGAKPHRVLLAGSGVSHFDRRFVHRQMPTLEAWLQYPHLDVGVIRRGLWLAGRGDLVPESGDGDLKNHRGLDDARMHLAEWRAYAAMIDQFVHHPA